MTKHEKAVQSTTAADATVDVTLNGLLDEALSQLKPWQLWAVERNFKRQPANRRQVLHSLEMHLAKTNPALITTMDAEGFGADTPFRTTVAGKGELLQIILDNLPAILEAIVKLIGLFSAILLACMLSTSSASAQDCAVSSTQGGPNCANGVCSLRARVSAAVGLPAVSHSSPQAAYAVAYTVAAPLHTPASAVAVTVSTRQRVRYRPLRAGLSGFRPVTRWATARRGC